MRLFLLPLALLLAVVPTASAQSDTQDVTVVVEEVNEISISNPVTLTLSASTAGGGFDDATNSGSTYAVTTNGTGKKITAKLGAEFAAGISLRVSVAAPAGATAAGSAQALNAATAVDLVTGLSQVSESGLGITYTASATSAASPNGAGETQTVTFTVTSI